MIYGTTQNNGICTCNLTVEQNGFLIESKAEWSTPTPLGEHFGKGCEVVDFDKGAQLSSEEWIGDQNLYVEISGEESRNPMHQRFSGRNRYFNFEDVVKSFRVEVPYGTSCLFTYTLEPVLFSFIDVKHPDGSIEHLENISLSVEDRFLYHQHEDTESWASEQEKVLFWPWESVRR